MAKRKKSYPKKYVHAKGRTVRKKVAFEYGSRYKHYSKERQGRIRGAIVWKIRKARARRHRWNNGILQGTEDKGTERLDCL
jgi:hypothetical protein